MVHYRRFYCILIPVLYPNLTCFSTQSIQLTLEWLKEPSGSKFSSQRIPLCFYSTVDEVHRAGKQVRAEHQTRPRHDPLPRFTVHCNHSQYVSSRVKIRDVGREVSGKLYIFPCRGESFYVWQLAAIMENYFQSATDVWTKTLILVSCSLCS